MTISHSNGLVETTNIEITPCSMRFGSEITFCEWQDKGKELGTVVKIYSNHVPWWLGDWIIAGEQYFPEKYSQALEETMYTIGRLKNCVYVCRHVPAENRFSELSFEHHYQVAKFDDKKKQREWLEKAIKNHWSVSQLRNAIMGRRVSTRAVPDTNPVRQEKESEGSVEKAVLCSCRFDVWWDMYDKKSDSPWTQENERKIAKDAWEEALSV